ncbi:MAG TPA: pyridoxal 5'-phosphate synthase glutaminase subunit PdxT [Microthrixaceae bacterium]|nr:pyridoxal 5'-phosphate synthase glutaminase subunit PdxT [Microthrixaceae bacterium]
MTTGVLALQGAFQLHQRALESLGQKVVLVRTPDQLGEIERLVIPGGESTTMSMLAERFELLDPLREFATAHPVLGTCAGAILLATEVLDGRQDQHCLGAIDISIRRNAFGSQVDSFEIELPIDELGRGSFHGVFIRAPIIERAGDDVEVLAIVDGRPALVRSGAILATTFHPELSGDLRLHELFLGM